MKNLLLVFVLILLAGCATKEAQTGDDPFAGQPYNRSVKRAYENQMRYSVFAPFMYGDRFIAYYALADKHNGPDKNGLYEITFKNGPQAGKTIKTDNVILKTTPASRSDLRKGMVVLVNHWDPKRHDDSAQTDMWRKAVVYNLDQADKGLVMLEFPYDSNDFMATKETYTIQNIRLILEPQARDPRTFLN
ncbi:MAG: hypothetical protein LBR90_03455 [Elusimicrobiota bacterium]|jgi:hypothetical protein|nr:hypothetical protein [Elusimicrobiota bacterium]